VTPRRVTVPIGSETDVRDLSALGHLCQQFWRSRPGRASGPFVGMPRRYGVPWGAGLILPLLQSARQRSLRPAAFRVASRDLESFFEGAIGEVAVSDDVLTQQQIQAIYATMRRTARAPRTLAARSPGPRTTPGPAGIPAIWPEPARPVRRAWFGEPGPGAGVVSLLFGDLSLAH
jgi:hypothetical protein